MRLLITTDPIGGVWTVTCELTAALLQDGHAVALVSFGRALNTAQQQICDGFAARYGERFLLIVSDAPLEWMQENEQTLPLGRGVLLDAVDRFGPEVVHANQFCWGALPLSVPCVITAHSDVLSWAAACRPQGLEASGWLDWYRALVQHGLDGATAVVSPTRWMRNALAEHFSVTCASDVLANGRSLPQLHDRVQRRLQAVSVGRLWDEAKGLQTLLNLTAPLPIVLAGEDRLEDAAASTGHLQALGLLDQAELTRVFQQSSVYLATSLYEPFGLAPLEAALCGCAVIARRLPSLQEVWGDAALYFESDAELDGILNLLAEEPARLRDAQARAQQRARHYSAQAMGQQYLALFRAVTASDRTTQQPVEQQALYAA